ncbi:MAG: cysteine desulfurase family protein, partial [Candidatus Margulisbacteria bacterium]|nr:cysteine desulfurase family protein [Candidatus Margulisiibacteriota bacterium]
MSQLIYLDHNATTYIDHSVAEAIRPYLFNHFANPSSIYSISQSVRKDLENAREHMAEMLGVKQGQIIFTSGGSESDNMAIKGAAFARSHKGKHIITSTIEHHAVLNSCAYLEKHGFEVRYISVDNQGVLNVEELEKAIRPDTILISIMAANNETGVIQPLEAVSRLAKKNGIPFHSDAVQIGGKIKIDIGNLGVDLLSLSAHKFYGPKGVGLLYINKGIQIDPLIHGGLQENGKRAGTENLAGIIGMEKALELCMNNYEVESDRETKLRDKLEKEILQIIPECMVNGQKASRLPNTL